MILFLLRGITKLFKLCTALLRNLVLFVFTSTPNKLSTSTSIGGHSLGNRTYRCLFNCLAGWLSSCWRALIFLAVPRLAGSLSLCWLTLTLLAHPRLAGPPSPHSPAPCLLALTLLVNLCLAHSPSPCLHALASLVSPCLAHSTLPHTLASPGQKV